MRIKKDNRIFFFRVNEQQIMGGPEEHRRYVVASTLSKAIELLAIDLPNAEIYLSQNLGTVIEESNG